MAKKPNMRVERDVESAVLNVLRTSPPTAPITPKTILATLKTTYNADVRHQLVNRVLAKLVRTGVIAKSYSLSTTAGDGTNDVGDQVLRALERLAPGWRPLDEILGALSDLAQSSVTSELILLSNPPNPKIRRNQDGSCFCARNCDDPA